MTASTILLTPDQPVYDQHEPPGWTARQLDPPSHRVGRGLTRLAALTDLIGEEDAVSRTLRIVGTGEEFREGE